MSQPIVLTNIVNAKDKAIPDTSLKSLYFTLSSELGFCAADNSSGSAVLRVVNLADPTLDNTIPMKADAAILAPHDPSIVVLRAPALLQVLSLATKQSLGRHTFPAAVTVDYWQWVDNERLAIVCPEAVYMWKYDCDEYTMLMQRDPALIANLQNPKVTSIQLSADRDWIALVAMGLETSSNSVQGNLQFHSISRNVSRVIPAHAATLTTYKESDVHPACTILTFAHKPAGAVEVDVNMIEAGPQKDANGVPLSGFIKKQFKIPINPAIAQGEFPMFMRSSNLYSFTYMVTKTGMLYVHDIGSGITVFQAPVSPRGVFSIAIGQHAECLFATVDGMVCRLDIDKTLIVDYMMTRLGKSEAAFKLAMRANLRGADRLFSAQFENLFSQRNWKEAALLCKKSPADTLRNAATLQRFDAAGDTVQIGEPAPVLIYLATMLENEGQLQNEAESLQLVKMYAQQGKIQQIETYFTNKKLFECEALGDAMLAAGLEKLAFKIYNQAHCHEKCILLLIQQNNLDAIVKYAERFPEYKPNYALIIQKGLGMGGGYSAEGIDKLKLFSDSVIQKMDMSQQYQEIVDICMSFKNFGYIKEASFLLLEVIKRLQFADESGPYQTAVLSINLEQNVPLAEALFAKNMLRSFDRMTIYPLCEKAGLYQRAFEFADSDEECLRIAIHYAQQTQKAIFESTEWYACYCRDCGRFNADFYNGDVQTCADSLFSFQQSLLEVVINTVRVYAPHVAHAFSLLPIIATQTELISGAVDVFKAYQLEGSDALFNFLAAIFPSSIDPQIHKMYLQAAIQSNHEQDIVRVARDSHYIVGSEAFDLLTTTPTKSDNSVVTALLTICSRFKLSPILGKFLCEAIIKREKTTQFFITNAGLILEQYLVSFAPEETHIVLKALFDNGVLSSNDVGVLDGIFSIDFLSRVLANQNVRDRCDISEVVEICMHNAKTIKIIRQMLEQRLVSGATDVITHTSFAKILIETRANECEKYLVENPYYDHYALCQFIAANDKRRKDSFVQTMALKCAVVGAFSLQNNVEIKNMKCAQFMIEFSFACAMYRELSSILLKRGSKQMWEMALVQEFKAINTEFFTMNGTRNLAQHREQFAVAVAQNNSINVEKLDEVTIAACIGSFVVIQDQDPKNAKCLMALLERVILTQGSIHMKNTQLHNLIIIAAVKAHELQKVSQYVKMNELVFDPDVVAPVCVQVGKDNNLPQFFEDSFEIYKRFGRLTEGVNILIKYMSLERAEKFAESQNDLAVFVVLGTAQLDIAKEYINNKQPQEATQLISKALRSYIRAKDGSNYRISITTIFGLAREYFATHQNDVIFAYNALIDYLRTIRTVMFIQGKYAEHIEIDSGLMLCYVKLDKFEELDSFLQLVNAGGSGIVPNKGDILQIGDRAFAEQKFAAAKMLYSKIQHWAKLAATLLQLQDYSNAVDAARRADDVPTWRQVNAVCLKAGQVALAKTAGLYLIVLPDELPILSTFYQKSCKIQELIELLESGIEHPQAKAYTNKEQNLFTHLALIYAKFMWTIDQTQQNKLMRFLKSNFDKVSIPLIIAESRKNLLWNEVVYLYVLSNENDQAVSEMMKHPSSFDHKQMLQICGYVSQPELLVQLVEFYIRYYPQHLNEYLKISKLGYFQADEMLEQKRKDFLSVDPLAVLRITREKKIERMVRPYFELLIEDNLLEINNELVRIYIQMRDNEALAKMIAKTTNFDTYSTLEKLLDEKQTPAMRRTAVALYSAMKKFDDGVQYAIKNRFYDEASSCAAASENGEKCENLLRMICSKDFPDEKIRKEIFAVSVARCGNMVRPDVVLELSWRFGMIDFAMPYMIGQMRSMTERLTALEQRKPAVVVQQQATDDGFGAFVEEKKENWGTEWK